MEQIIQSAASYLVAFGPFFLTALAAGMAIWPPQPKGRARWIWLAAIVIIGLPVSWATYFSSAASDKTSVDTNGVVHGLQAALASQKTDFDERYRVLDSRYDALNDNYSKIVSTLHLNPSDPINRILEKLDALTPHTFIVHGGETIQIPPVTGQVSVETAAGKPTTVELPNSPYTGERLDIADSTGNATSVPITVDGGSRTIAGSPKYVMLFGHQSITVSFDGKNWNIN